MQRYNLNIEVSEDDLARYKRLTAPLKNKGVQKKILGKFFIDVLEKTARNDYREVLKYIIGG